MLQRKEDLRCVSRIEKFCIAAYLKFSWLAKGGDGGSRGYNLDMDGGCQVLN